MESKYSSSLREKDDHGEAGHEYNSVNAEPGQKNDFNKKALVIIGSLVALLISLITILYFVLQNGKDTPKPKPDVAPVFADNPRVFHMIAHSHDDLGWIIPERDYSNLIVSRVIRTSADFIINNPGSKFSMCNIGFLKHWIDQDAINNTALFKKAVDTGRMEILNGGYAVHDNAAVYFDDIISTYEYGREFVYQHFNYITRTGWLIDPFGLSLTTSRIYAEMGYNQYVTNRMSTWERDLMRNSSQLQKNWVVEGKPEYDMWISEMANHYQTEGPFNVDTSLGGLGDQYPVINILNSSFNLMMKTQLYLGNTFDYASWFNTKHIMSLFGGDFYFRNFGNTYQYYQALVVFMRSNQWTGRLANNVTYKISTAEDYFNDVKADAVAKNLVFPEKKGDFFPYVEHDDEIGMLDPMHSAWTGYFVSNPHAKKSIRSFGEAVRGLKSLMALFELRGQTDDISLDEITNQADKYHWQIGINTHHDTITGTSTNYAAATYLENTRNELWSVNSTFNLFIVKYFNANPFGSYENLTLLHPNEEYLKLQGEHTYMFISQGGVQNKVIRMLNNWTGAQFTLVENGELTKRVPVSTTCNLKGVCEHIMLENYKVGEGRFYSTAELNATFTKKDIVFAQQYKETIAGQSVTFSLEDGFFTFTDGTNTVKFALHQYIWSKTDPFSQHPNGKYIFCSATGSTQIMPDVGTAIYTLNADGSILDVHIGFLSTLWSVNFKYLPNAPETHRYSVRMDSGILYENVSESDTNYVIRYYSDIKNGKDFVTESNGLELLTRTFGINTTVVDENYYPLTRFMGIEDGAKRMTVMIDRAQGGTSPAEGVVEIMVNRRSTQDDWKGANEGTYEEFPISVLHYVVFDVVGPSDKQNRRLHQAESDNPMISFRAHASESDYPILSEYGASGVQGVDNPLIRVLFDRRSNGRLMMRLYNYDDKNTNSLDLKDLVSNKYNISYKTIVETGIDFNFKTSEMNSWDYRWNKKTFPDWKGETLTLKPLQIRTFEISI
jgi:hypothetical protein